MAATTHTSSYNTSRYIYKIRGKLRKMYNIIIMVCLLCMKVSRYIISYHLYFYLTFLPSIFVDIRYIQILLRLFYFYSRFKYFYSYQDVSETCEKLSFCDCVCLNVRYLNFLRREHFQNYWTTDYNQIL